MYTTINFQTAIRYANERSGKTNWHFSIIERINMALRDYEFQVIAFIHDDALYVTLPQNNVS